LQIECRFLTEEGRVRRLTCQATPLPGDESETPGYLGSLWDVTERHRTVQRLRESESRYRLLAENVSDLIERETPEGRLLYVSPASRPLLGYEPSELEGHSFEELELVHTADQEELDRSRRELLTSDATQMVRYRILRADGDYATFESSKRMVRDDGGRPLEIVSVSRDVTRQRGLEEQLRQAQKMEAIGQFAGGVAHDFNNVLTVILGHADVLEASLPGDTPESADARAIRESAERAARLTRQLLAYTRRQVLEPSLVDLNLVIGDMESMLRRLLSEATELVWEPLPELGSVHVDRGQLEQVLMNLAINARDALGHGGKLTLRT
jgi:PAS domain S-box-containing protein